MTKYKRGKHIKKTKKHVQKKSNKKSFKKRSFKTILKAGGQIPLVQAKNELPSVKVEQVVIKPVPTQQKNTNIDIVNTQKGGGLPPDYVGSTWGNLVVGIFSVSQATLDQFKRIVKSPMDCVVSAMQIIGILDNDTANIVRLTAVGHLGITLEQIENIFSLKFNKKFVFKSTKNINEFVTYINTNLPKNFMMFCGIKYAESCDKHVFLIARDNNDRVVKIDPQASNPMCSLDNDSVCLEQFSGNTSEYYLLHHYTGYLTNEEKIEMGIFEKN